MTILALATLKAAYPCAEQYDIVAAEWPDGIPLTDATASRIVELKLDVDWAAEHLLDEQEYDEYERVRAPALAEYRRVSAPALAEYKRVSAPALAEYRRVSAKAWAEYERVSAPALAEYERVSAPALAEYERVRAPALAEYKRVSAPALISIIARRVA